jgi:hypothetical protein
VAFWNRAEVSTLASAIGLHTSHRDVAFQALVDAVSLARNSLIISPAPSVIIYTADHFTIPWCLTMDRYDNMKVCKTVCNLVAEILFSYLDTTLAIKWIPGYGSFHPLKRLMEVAQVVAAELAPPAPLSTTPTALQATTQAQAL